MKKNIAIALIIIFLASGTYYLKLTREEASKVVKYNCEESGGTFGESCVCPIEEQLGQTQEMMYDKETGYCQTTAGGPGGNIMEQMLNSGTQKNVGAGKKIYVLEKLYGMMGDTKITSNLTPLKLTIANNPGEFERILNMDERDKCTTTHPFGFETYSGEYTTSAGVKMQRLSYPELGDGTLFIADEYSIIVESGECLTFSFTTKIANGVVDGKYNEEKYSKELKITEEIMETLRTDE